MKFLLGLIFISACFLGGGPYQPAPRAGDKNALPTREVWHSPTQDQWKRSPWYRIALDMVTPSRVVISTSGWACIMDVMEVAEPDHLEQYVCKSEWRRPSGRNDD